MKKLFTKVAIFVAALAFPFTLVSCDNEELMTILGQVLEQMLAGQGTKYNFNGTASGAYAMYNVEGSDGNYIFVDEKNQSSSFSMSLPVTIGNNAASIDFPAVEVNGISFPAISLTKLSATADGDFINIDVSEASDVSKTGSITVDGKTYDFWTVFFDKVKFTTNQSTGVSTLTAGTIQLYFGTATKHYVVNYSYNGTATAAAQ